MFPRWDARLNRAFTRVTCVKSKLRTSRNWFWSDYFDLRELWVPDLLGYALGVTKLKILSIEVAVFIGIMFHCQKNRHYFVYKVSEFFSKNYIFLTNKKFQLNSVLLNSKLIVVFVACQLKLGYNLPNIVFFGVSLAPLFWGNSLFSSARLLSPDETIRTLERVVKTLELVL